MFKRAGVMILVGVWSFCVLGESKKVLDLGELEITGELRRPNVSLVHSKRYFEKAVRAGARDELKRFEKELLKPAPVIKTPRSEER